MTEADHQQMRREEMARARRVGADATEQRSIRLSASCARLHPGRKPWRLAMWRAGYAQEAANAERERP